MVFSVVEITVGISVALAIAFLLSRVAGRLQRVFLALYYLPVVVPTVVTVLAMGLPVLAARRRVQQPVGGVGLPSPAVCE